MAVARSLKQRRRFLPDAVETGLKRLGRGCAGAGVVCFALAGWASLASWSIADPSFSNAVNGVALNWLGQPGAILADLALQMLGLAAIVFFLPVAAWGKHLMSAELPDRLRLRLIAWPAAVLCACAALAALPQPRVWPLENGIGGIIGDFIIAAAHIAGFLLPTAAVSFVAGLVFLAAAIMLIPFACGSRASQLVAMWAPQGGEVRLAHLVRAGFDGSVGFVQGLFGAMRESLERRRAESLLARPLRDFDPHPDEILPDGRIEPVFDADGRPVPAPQSLLFEADPLSAGDDVTAPAYQITRGQEPKTTKKAGLRIAAPEPSEYRLPPMKLLQTPPKASRTQQVSDEVLRQNARALEGVLLDFGVKGEIVNVRPGPVVTLYELEPAPGTKSSRVIGLADDIARSMSAIAARVAVVPGRNAIGIELPNAKRETVLLRELLETQDFSGSETKLALALGKNIGGEPVVVDLSRMPHLLIAGTTGSGKSVGINTMILSLLYRMAPDQCKFIMIDPKMLELSVYDGIPHLLAPVVTDPKKAVVALKWTVREMEERYKKMSKLGVRNIAGYNARVREAAEAGEALTRTVQTGFDKETGEALYEQEEMDYEPLPFIVVIVDEMADLMMVAGKDNEGAVQRLAQMARAAGIHIITATQRPSVDVITGTIKANFPTRVSFQVTSKIDSRTILGEGGADQLLGQGDMLYMAGGGRIMRVHGPFVSDDEVEKIVRFLKSQGAPAYLSAITESADDEDSGDEDGEITSDMMGEGGDSLYDKAVNVVLRDRKVSTSYVQRRLGVGYNKAASLIERMEQEGVISGPNSQGKREILVGDEAVTPY